MALHEYLYVDDARLDQYVEQIASTVTYDKVPVWEARLSLKGPEAGASQERHARALSRHEKIACLLEHLKKHGHLDEGRLKDRGVFFDNERVFHLETCAATKILIPALSPAPGEFSGINVWFADGQRGRVQRRTIHAGHLLLIVGFSRDDEGHFRAWSAYSALASFLNDMYAQVERTVLRPFIGQMRTDPSAFQERFLADPAAALADIGAKISASRRITTLYRVREAVLYREPSTDTEAIATYGYPIFIRDGDESRDP